MSIQKSINPDLKSRDYQNDFVKTTQVLYRRRWLVIIGILSFTVVSIILSFIIPRVYKSEGFYQLSRTNKELKEEIKSLYINTDQTIIEILKSAEDKIAFLSKLTESEKSQILAHEYKKNNSLFTNPQMLFSYIEKKSLLNQNEINKLKTSIRTSNDISKLINPVYTYTREDQEVLVRIPIEETNIVLGVNLEYESTNPKRAQNFVEIVGEFIRECILYSKLNDYTDSKYNIAVEELNKYENQMIDIEFRLNQLAEKREYILSILDRYPESSKMINREVVSVEKEGYRYLSPIAQLVGIESSIADKKENLAFFIREKGKSEILFDFYSKLKENIEKKNLWDSVFDEFLSFRDEFFEDRDLNNDIVKEIYNLIAIDVENFKNKFDESMGFVSMPSLPQQSVKPKKRVIVVAGFFIGLVFFIFLAFLLEFWKKHKESIKKGNID